MPGSDRLPAGLAPVAAAGFRTVALTPAGDALDVDLAAARGLLDDPVALVVGAEGPGLYPGHPGRVRGAGPCPHGPRRGLAQRRHLPGGGGRLRGGPAPLGLSVGPGQPVRMSRSTATISNAVVDRLGALVVPDHVTVDHRADQRLAAVLRGEHGQDHGHLGRQLRVDMIPSAAGPATYSKCAVSPRMTQPMATTAS